MQWSSYPQEGREEQYEQFLHDMYAQRHQHGYWPPLKFDHDDAEVRAAAVRCPELAEKRRWEGLFARRCVNEGHPVDGSPFMLMKKAEEDRLRAEQQAVREAQARKDNEERIKKIAADKAAAERKARTEANQKRKAEEKAAAEQRRKAEEARKAKAAAAARLTRDASGLVHFVLQDDALNRAIDSLGYAKRRVASDYLEREEKREAEQWLRVAQQDVKQAFEAANAWMGRAKRILETAGFLVSVGGGNLGKNSDDISVPCLFAIGQSTDVKDTNHIASDAGPSVIAQYLAPSGVRRGSVAAGDKNVIEMLRGRAIGNAILCDFCNHYATVPVTRDLHLPDAMPVADWLPRVRLGYSFADFDAAMVACGNNPMLAAVAVSRLVPPRCEAACVIDGLIPVGVLTFLAGAAGKGKTSLFCDMAQAIACGAETACGFAVNPAFHNKTVAYLYAEDRDRDVRTRFNQMDGLRGPSKVLLIPADAMTIDEALALLRDVPDLGAVFIDPLLPWLTRSGATNENDNTEMSAQMDRFVALARAKNCAVVVAHHLVAPARNKKSEPRTPELVAAAMRGAQVFRDRARVVMTLHREGGDTVLGVAKSNVQESIPEGECRLSFDTTTRLFTRIGEWVSKADSGKRPNGRTTRPASSAKKPDVSSASQAPARDPDGDAAVMAAVVARLVGTGLHVRKRGDSEPYQHMRCGKPAVPELEGWGRNRCRNATDAAVAAGLLVNDPGVGLRPADAAPLPMAAE